MRIWPGKPIALETERMTLRLPQHGDYMQWANLRRESQAFLTRWEPSWTAEHLTRGAFITRVQWAKRATAAETSVPFFLIRRGDDALLGALTISNIRRGPAQSATTGYWIGQRYARQGYMREALKAAVHFCFTRLDLSRMEAGCLPENTPSRQLLESCGYKYEGVAQSYLQIDGRWRNHVLYANLRSDRRGKTDVG